MNGSLFAQLLSLSQWSRLVTSTTHNPLRKLGFCVLFVYQCLSLLLSFLLLGNMYFAYAILFRVLGMSMAEASLNGDGSGAAVAVRSAFSGLVSARVTRDGAALQYGRNMCGAACYNMSHPMVQPVVHNGAPLRCGFAHELVDTPSAVPAPPCLQMWLFQLILCITFVYSLGNRPEESETVWSVCVHLLGAFSTASVAITLWLIRDFSSNWAIWTGGMGAVGAIFLCALLQRRFGNVLVSVLQYMWMSPAYLVVLPIFSTCQLNDVSWGTREAHATASQAEVKARMDRQFREFRSRIVIVWILINLVFSQALDNFSRPGASANGSPAQVRSDALLQYVVGMAGVAAFMLGLRVLGCFAYVGVEWTKYCCCSVSTRLGRCCRTPAPPYSAKLARPRLLSPQCSRGAFDRSGDKAGGSGLLLSCTTTSSVQAALRARAGQPAHAPPSPTLLALGGSVGAGATAASARVLNAYRSPASGHAVAALRTGSNSSRTSRDGDPVDRAGGFGSRGDGAPAARVRLRITSGSALGGTSCLGGDDLTRPLSSRLARGRQTAIESSGPGRTPPPHTFRADDPSVWSTALYGQGASNSRLAVGTVDRNSLPGTARGSMHAVFVQETGEEAHSEPTTSVRIMPLAGVGLSFQNPLQASERDFASAVEVAASDDDYNYNADTAETQADGSVGDTPSDDGACVEEDAEVGPAAPVEIAHGDSNAEAGGSRDEGTASWEHTNAVEDSGEEAGWVQEHAAAASRWAQDPDAEAGPGAAANWAQEPAEVAATSWVQPLAEYAAAEEPADEAVTVEPQAPADAGAVTSDESP